MAKAAKKSTKSSKPKEPPIFIKVAYGLLQRKPNNYTVEEMAMDIFNHNAMSVRKVIRSHFYHARDYLEREFGEIVIPVTNGKDVTAYKCADPDNEEDVLRVQKELLRRGTLSDTNNKRLE